MGILTRGLKPPSSVDLHFQEHRPFRDGPFFGDEPPNLVSDSKSGYDQLGGLEADGVVVGGLRAWSERDDKLDLP